MLINCWGLSALPDNVRDVIEVIVNSGVGVPLLVGGCVRDAVRGIVPKDFDIEVQGCTSFDVLARVLDQSGRLVNYVGKSFAVLKVGSNIEVALPRKDNLVGSSHQDFEVEVLDKSATFYEASLRRDLTINAMGFDPIACVLHDPHNGVRDLNNRVARCVDAERFGEDPLRPWRAMQFIARMKLKPDSELIDVSRCVVMNISQERVYGEVVKWLMPGNDYEAGWDFLVAANLQRFSTIWARHSNQQCEQTVRQTLAVVHQVDQDADALLLGLLVVMHAYSDIATKLLKHLSVPVRICKQIAYLSDLWLYWREHQEVNFPFVEKLLRHESLMIPQQILVFLPEVFVKGDKILTMQWKKDIINWFAVKETHRPIVTGRDLRNCGFTQGPHIGEALRQCHQHQVVAGCLVKETLLKLVQKEKK